MKSALLAGCRRAGGVGRFDPSSSTSPIRAFLGLEPLACDRASCLKRSETDINQIESHQSYQGRFALNG